MLDENLPTFFLKPSITGTKHHNDFYLAQHGSEPEPAYHLEHGDPASLSPTLKNCYATALFDAYNPDVLFGEVLARPEWKRPSVAEGQGGIPPAPQPILPNEFTVQLYNPDQQVRVEIKSSKWGGQDSYEFSMPQDSFRAPSSSSLDRGASDPASLEVTPRLNFVWRKDGMLGKDLTCFLTGKSTDTKKKSSKKDPDISIALWRHGKELTLYEPNLQRVEMEDPKGLEVVLLITAVVIKDLYFSAKDQMREIFNISEAPIPPQPSNAGPRNPSSSATTPLPSRPTGSNGYRTHSTPNAQPIPQQTVAANVPPPFPDARAKWESDAETARLKAQAQQEKYAADKRRKEQENKDSAEAKRLQKVIDDEAKAAQKRQSDLNKETERLRKMYGVKPIPNNQSRPQPQTGPNVSAYGPGPYLRPGPPPQPGGPIYGRPSASASNIMMSGANGYGAPQAPLQPQGILKKKTSFWR